MESTPKKTPLLAKTLAATGALSRRHAAEAIKNGRVSVNGAVVSDPAARVTPDARIELDGRPVAAETKVYIMLNKPAGYVCTNSDPHATLRAVDLIDLGRPARLYSAGRLDAASEGMLIFSNDGDFVLQLTHPRYGVLKEDRVETRDPLPREALDRIRRGIRDDGEFLRPEQVDELTPRHYRFILNEGRKREIRRLVTAAGSRVVRLIRVRTGSLALGGLPPGQWRELEPEETAAVLVNP